MAKTKTTDTPKPKRTKPFPALRLFAEEKERALDKVKQNGLHLADLGADLQGDKDVVLAAVEQDGMALQYARNYLKAIDEIVSKAVKQNWMAYAYASPGLQEDSRICRKVAIRSDFSLHPSHVPDNSWRENLVLVTEAVRVCPWQLGCASPKLTNNKEVLMRLVNISPDALEFVPDQYKADEDVVLAAVTSSQSEITVSDKFPSASMLHHASPELTNDKEFILRLVRIDGKALEHVSPQMKADKDVVLSAVTSNGSSLRFAADHLQSDKDVILAASGETKRAAIATIQQHGLFFLDLEPKLQINRDIVLAAVCRKGILLEHVSEIFKADHKIVLSAVENDWRAFKHASSLLQKDRLICWNVATSVDFTLENVHVTDAWKENGILVAIRVSEEPSELQYASPKLRNDKEFMLRLLSDKGSALEYAPEDFKADKDIVLAAMTDQKPTLYISRRLLSVPFSHASPSLKDDKEFVLRLLRINPHVLEHVSERLRDDKETVLVAVSYSGHVLQYASETLKADRDVALVALTNSGSSLSLVAVELHSDKEVVLTAVRQNAMAFEFVDSSSILRQDPGVLSAAKRLGHKYQPKAKMTPESAREAAAKRLEQREAKSASEAKKSQLWNQLRAKLGECPPTWSEQDIAMRIVSQDHRAFQYAPESVRANKWVVIEAVSHNADMLKYALRGLNQDRDCWIAAGLWSEEQQTKRNLAPFSSRAMVVRIALSTRFSLEEKSKSSVTKFTKLLNENPFFRDGNFSFYSPNAFSKATCDPDWTNMDWPCRGTFDTCQKEPSLRMGKPQSACCWRYSFRWHLEEAKATNGFMLQVVDLDGEPGLFEPSPSAYVLGNGQQIESVMAGQVGVKVFRIFRPRTLTANNGQLLQDFRADHINDLAHVVGDWRNQNCADMSVHEVSFEERLS